MSFPDHGRLNLSDPIAFLSSLHHGNPSYVYTVAEMTVLSDYLGWDFVIPGHCSRVDPFTISDWLIALRHFRNSNSSEPPSYSSHGFEA